MSKIQIWKRITTYKAVGWNWIKLYLICQRYKFESESQHVPLRHSPCVAVFNMSKIQIWKRITTKRFEWNLGRLLYLICQRYKFESESQPGALRLKRIKAVFNMSKIQIWKRITTQLGIQFRKLSLYLICQRYKFESESQLNSVVLSFLVGCI